MAVICFNFVLLSCFTETIKGSNYERGRRALIVIVTLTTFCLCVGILRITFKTMATSGIDRNKILDDLENEVSEVTALLRNNVEKVLERGERIEKLQSRSEDLEYSASNFTTGAAKLRKKLWWKNCKLFCLLAAMIFFLIAIIILVIIVLTKPWASSGNVQKHNGTHSVVHGITGRPADVMLFPQEGI